MAKQSKSKSTSQSSSWWAQEEPESVFSELLGGGDIQEFFSKSWEKEPLIIRAPNVQRRRQLTDLFSRECLDRILKKERIDFGLHMNSCRFMDGQRENLNPDENPESGEPIRATAKRVWKLFDDERATLQFHQPQQFQNSLWRLCSSLESYFGCLVGSNIYMTPGGAQGLAPHHDDVEVFIIQLEGKKHWRLYSPLVKLACSSSEDLDVSEIGEPTHDFTLEAGDVLYFPRGTIHQADTPAGVAHSTHITISTYQGWTYGELLRVALPEALEAAMSDSSATAFRQGLPLNVMRAAGSGQAKSVDQRSKSAIEEVRKTLTSLVDRLSQYLEPSSAVDDFNVDFLRSRLPPPPEESTVQKSVADEPAAKRKKGGKAASEDANVVDLTSESGAGDPVGPKPTSGSKVCLLHRHHIRVVVGTGLSKPEDEFDDDLPSDMEDQSDEEAADGDDSALGLDGAPGFPVGEDESDDDDDDSEVEDEVACFLYFDFDNIRRHHMISAGDPPDSSSSVKLPLTCTSAIGKLLSQVSPVSVTHLCAEEEDAVDLAMQLWSMGLLSVQ